VPSSTRSLANSQAGHADGSVVIGQAADVGGAGHAARSARLGRYANRSSPASSKQGSKQQRKRKQRLTRWVLRHRLRRLTKLKRVRKCGYCTAGAEGGGPGLRLTADSEGGNIAGLSGLTTCGSVWACPVCSAKIATRRADELADVMRFALEQGCSASMVTLTIRHHDGQRLKDCWKAVSKGWEAVTSGKQWDTDRAKHGLVGWVRTVEVTHGANGWHVHVHALLIWENKVSQEQAEFVGERMHRRWTRRVQKRGFDSLRDSGGLDVRMATLKPGKGSGLHEYFVKLSHEITGGQAKLAKGGGRTPFQILNDVFEAGEAMDVALWQEWEDASFNRRQLTWSTAPNNLREWAGLGREQKDEEIAEEELGAEDVLFIESDSWCGQRDDRGHYLRNGLRDDPGQCCELLAVAEDGGYPAVMSWLDRHGMGYVVVALPPPLPPPPRDHEHWELRRDRVHELRSVVRGAVRELSEQREWHRLLREVGIE